MLYVRYQEQIILNNGSTVKVIDAHIPMYEFNERFIDPIIAESLFNSMREWHDNGICNVTGKHLEHRILGVVCGENIGHLSNTLDKIPTNNELLDMIKNK